MVKENEYIEDLHHRFGVGDEDKTLFERIITTPTERRSDILDEVNTLIERVNLSYGLLALYRQQVNSGFVLADPLVVKEEKRFFDADTGIEFLLQWNPDRELRKNHALLIERGVIAEQKGIDESKLVNRDGGGKPCYLCKQNIDEQNPGEILLEIGLAGEAFYIGANFAYITNEHFTVMNAEHRAQEYREQIPKFLNDFVDKTDGYFRAIFNGLAGASIKEHEHLQVTTEQFPIEQIRIEDEDVVYKGKVTRVSRPNYYVPVWVVEGRDKAEVEVAVDRIISRWYGLDGGGRQTENIIAVKAGRIYRTFVILRDKNKLAVEDAGKKGAMASFETGGNIVLSVEPTDKEGVNERETFDKATLETVKQMLEEISPDERLCRALAEVVSFEDILA